MSTCEGTCSWVISIAFNITFTLAAKSRRKSVAIILCACVCVHKILGKLHVQTLVAPMSYCHTSNFDTRIENNKRCLLKKTCYKVVTIFSYCLQTWEDSWGHLDTSKHNHSCIMAIASKALHQSKQNWDSGCYNIEQ